MGGKTLDNAGKTPFAQTVVKVIPKKVGKPILNGSFHSVVLFLHQNSTEGVRSF